LTIAELAQEENSEKAKNHFQTLVKEGFASDEGGFVTKSGEKRFWSVDAVKLSETRFLGFAKDITERKQAENKLRESEENYRLIFESTGTATIIFDEDTTILQANNECRRVAGYSPKELVGTSWTEYVYKEDLPKVLENAKARLKDPSLVPSKYEVRIINANKEIRNAILSIGFIPESKRSIVSILDITERKQTEEELNKRSEAMEASMDGISILDENEKYVYVNDAHARIYGYDSPKELLEKSWKVLYDEEELARFENVIMPQFIDEGKWKGEAVGKKKDGTKFPQEVSLTAIEDGGLICVVRDITERKQAEEALKVSEEKFRKSFSTSPDSININRLEDGMYISTN